MRILISIVCLVFLIQLVVAQTPESPVVQKKKLDSLFLTLKQLPEKGSKANDTNRINIMFNLIKRTYDDTMEYYVNYAFRLCSNYSPVVANAEIKTKVDIQEILKKDIYLGFYLRSKSRLLLILGRIQRDGNKKVHYYLNSLKIYEKMDDKRGMASAYTHISNVYYHQFAFAKAIENILVAQNIYREIGDKLELANTYFTLGDIYQLQSDFDRSLQNYTEALNIAKQINNVFECGVYYERIGNCYIDMGNFPKAIENHFASLKMSEKLEDIKGVGDSYGDIAAIYLSMNNYQKSLDNYLAALNKYKEFAAPEHIGNGYKDVAKLNHLMHKNETALSYLDSALVMYENEEIDYYVATTYSLMSDVYVEKRDISKAIDCINKEIAIGRKRKYIELLKDGYNKLSAIYVKQNDYKEAYHYHLLYTEMKDSSANSGDETVANITEMQSKFDKEKAEQERLLHEAVLAQKESRLEQERTQRYALYGGLALVLVFSVFLFNRFRVTQKQKIIIEEQKQLVDEAFKNLKEKNKEVMDSITYARRIQRAVVTSEMYIEKQLNRLIKDNKESS
ncbi:MAG: tetratricopeptide repeat protein [Bacteroidota bacterium]